MTRTYATFTDLIAQEIAPALAGTDCSPERVADRMCELDLIVLHEATEVDGTIYLNESGLQMVATTDEFWAVVAEVDAEANR